MRYPDESAASWESWSDQQLTGTDYDTQDSADAEALREARALMDAQ